jgi:hypothetical protein
LFFSMLAWENAKLSGIPFGFFSKTKNYFAICVFASTAKALGFSPLRHNSTILL